MTKKRSSEKRNSEILVREKFFPSPPNSGPGLRHCVIPRLER